jgi:hypothetical protein
MSNLLKNLLFALGLSVLLWVGYMVFLRGDGDELLAPSSTVVSPEAEIETQKLLATIQKIKSYKVDGAFFQDERFKSLRDFRTTLVEEPFGRSNPFAPVD